MSTTSNHTRPSKPEPDAGDPAASESLSPLELDRLRGWLEAYGKTPEVYIIDCFERHQVVLLGEDHAIKHNLLLAQSLVPLLHAAGVYSLGMEFGASEDQSDLDELVGVTGTSADYDEATARKLMFNYNTSWAYREYMDIYRAAWTLNRSRPTGTRPFRILNLSYRYNWREAGPVRTPANTWRVFHKGGTEPYRASLLKREILDRNDKILVLTGTPHAFSRFALPVFDYNSPGFYRLDSGFLGHLLYREVPEQVYTILLHQPFESRLEGAARLVLPANGAIDQVKAGSSGQPVGFDLANTPFGALQDNSFYATGAVDFRMEHLADGYIYDRPFDRYEGCTIDEDFVTTDNLPEAQANFPDPHWHARPNTPEAYWAHVYNYVDIARRYSRLDTGQANTF